MAADDMGWFAKGWAFEGGAQLTATVQCMTPPGGGGDLCTGCAVGGTVKFDWLGLPLRMVGGIQDPQRCDVISAWKDREIAQPR